MTDRYGGSDRAPAGIMGPGFYYRPEADAIVRDPTRPTSAFMASGRDARAPRVLNTRGVSSFHDLVKKYKLYAYFST